MSRTGNKQGTGYRVQGIGYPSTLLRIPFGRRVPRTAYREKKGESAPKGLTLVEILLAVVVLSIGVAGVLRAYAGSVQTLEITQENIEAINLLKEKMAEIQQEIIEEKGLSAGSSTGDFEGGLKNYAWESVVQPGPHESLHELRLVVYQPGQTRQFSLATYVENKDYKK